ncbi:MAG: histidine phosphatase family protein [Symploca sp. SIO2D2]|nr:histidine phosphatase family protein [Symploca sp. SIO2D2]
MVLSAVMKIHVARHGIREDHIDPDWKSKAAYPDDPGLHSSGLKQAGELGDFLKEKGIQIIYTSPFLRAVQTALELDKRLGVGIRMEKGLCESLRPEWFERMPKFKPGIALLRSYSGFDSSWESVGRPSFPEPESELASDKRLAVFIEDFIKIEKRDCVLVGHGAVVHGLSEALLPANAKPCYKTCALNVMEGEGSDWKLSYADNEFLSIKEEKLLFE